MGREIICSHNSCNPASLPEFKNETDVSKFLFSLWAKNINSAHNGEDDSL
jgi:hypothetical protein